MKYFILAAGALLLLGAVNQTVHAQDAEISEAEIEAAAELANTIQSAIDALPEGASEDDIVATILAVLDSSTADETTKSRALAAVEQVAQAEEMTSIVAAIGRIRAQLGLGTGGIITAGTTEGGAIAISVPPVGTSSGGSDY